MKKAIDIVLLPPAEITELAVKLNEPWVKRIDDEIELNKNTCLPHMTLAMGVMDDSQLNEVKNIMAEIATQVSALELKIIGVNVNEHPDGKKMSGLEIERSPELQKLHEFVMDKLVPLFTYDDVTKEMFYSPPPVSSIPLHWTEGFVKTLVREKYWPHITLGLGVPENTDFPINFTASRFALCHLGTYCTCREILAEYNLS